MQAKLFHDTACQLGEGPLWAHDRLFFFDIDGKRLHALDADARQETWELGMHGSAAGKLADGKLMIVTDAGFEVFDPANGDRRTLMTLEADMPGNRPNDGRADRQGGFWIGTMSKTSQVEAGAIYRYYRGQVRMLFPRITIPNAICFSPDGRTAFFADSRKREIYRVSLDEDGWPADKPQLFYRPDGAVPDGAVPDGAVVDAQGGLLVAIWGGSRAIRVSPDGQITHDIGIAAAKVTCPAFGPDGKVYFTTARVGLGDAELADQPHAGGIFVADAPVPGIEEPVVQL